MKNLYSSVLLALAALTFGGAQAQNYVYNPVQYLEHEVSNGSFEIIDIFMATPTDEDITYAWELTDNTFPAAWTYSICDYSGCYPGGTLNATMTPLTIADMQAGTSAFLKLNLTTGTTSGNGILEFYVYDESDYSRGDVVTFDLTWDNATGVTEVAPLLLNMGPNPVTDVLNVQVGTNIVNLSITDMTGKVLEANQLTANTRANIDFSAYPAGIYFVRSESATGRMHTERVIKR
jgi:hypothetical protein